MTGAAPSPASHPDGIYFGMDDATYHAIPALSATGIKHLSVSPFDFWARSWMNPLREDEDSDARMTGRAYHSRIVEGKAAFAKRYAPAFDAGAHPHALDTMDDLKTVLRDRGERVGGSKADLVERLKAVAPEIETMDALRSAYGRTHAGREFLSRNLIAKIEIAAAMIEKHPTLSKCFAGGAPEVTVIWEVDGIRKKMRADFLKPAAIVDLKTFGNPMGLNVEKAIYRAMASGKYVIQAAHYLDGLAAAREHLKAGRVHGDTPKGFALQAEHQFVFVFQATGVAPVARAFVLPDGLARGIGQAFVSQGTALYARCAEHFGADPWLYDPDDPGAIQTFDDAMFPQWMGD